VSVKILRGDCQDVLRTLDAQSVNACITSPPYFSLRSYLAADHPDKPREIGSDQALDEYVDALVGVFREVRRILRDDGVLWLNLGDSYCAHPGQRKATDSAGPKQATNEGSTGTPSRHVEGLKPKDLIGVPWMVAFALRADGGLPPFLGRWNIDSKPDWRGTANSRGFRGR
jgi:hypothetical protein